MKLRQKSLVTKKPKAEKVESKATGQRRNIYLSDTLHSQFEDVRERYDRHLNLKLTLSGCLADGLELQIAQLNKQLQQANKGSFHAKKRKNKS